jgi:hypothetical protein
MRITVFMIFLQAAVFHDLCHIIIKFFLRDQLMLPDCLSNDLTDRETRGQGRIRILENDLHFGTQIPKFFLIELIDILSVKKDASFCLFDRRRMVLPVVDFPQPDSPTRPMVVPRLILKETSSTAFTWPVTPPKNPPLIGKYFLR